MVIWVVKTINIIISITWVIINPISAYGSQEKEINEFCKNKVDIESCFQYYEGLPKLEEIPFVPAQDPIKIKVLPYNSRFEQSRNKKERDCLQQLCIEDE